MKASETESEKKILKKTEIQKESKPALAAHTAHAP